ncbi:initiator RepB protein [Candidatus Magnetobacterium bavaricum]|uniref:Initiator RepB protein n=1 Tax=Candidatus Magnetobacterium bavaricum TaxID=29290 RepID=A0A0F3GKP0_9BACT|nr:initiator RepB protein [Candidatus Magnetobacterium bavaricum]
MTRRRKENALVVKSNDLIEARYDLTLTEQRVILYMVSMIEPKDDDFKTYRITVSEFAEIMEIDRSDAYRQIRLVTESLISNVIRIYKTETNSYLSTSWLSSSHYFVGEGYVELRFDPGLKPYLLNMKERFTSYKLTAVARLNSSYSIRIYEILKQYQKIGIRTFTITDLRTILGVDDKEYPFYWNFKAKVILVAQRELVKSTDISFTFKETKTGRKVTGIVFTIITNPTEPPDAIPPKKSKTLSTDPINVTPTPQQPLKPSKKSKSAPTQIVDVIPITPTLRVETTIQPEPIGAKSSKPRQESIAKPINTADSNSSTVGTTAKPQHDPVDIASLLDL